MGRASAILMLTSRSEVFTPAELSMASVLSLTPRSADPATLGHAEIGALADHLGADLRAADADRVIAAVADRIVALRGGAHIGTDAAKEEQIDRRFEDRFDHFVRGRLGRGEAERGARFRRKRNLLRRARKHAAALGNERPVVVLPARARQLEQALPLGEAFLRIGGGGGA